MRRPTYRRATQRRGPDRRIIAAVAVLVAFGGVIGVTQISNADENKIVACGAPAAAATAAGGKNAATDPRVGSYTDKDGDLQHKGDGQLAKGEKAPAPVPVKECIEGKTTVKQVNGLEILTNTCDDSKLEGHDGFQKGDRCVSTEFGEVGDQSKNPTLLITEFPKTVKANTPFTLKVSTRNLVRDRFLAAGQGGYYVESSVLTAEGLVRGHFHTACRMLAGTNEAPDPAPVPAFFVATEDKKGGGRPDTVTIQVPGLPQEGIAQCASWAGDGSHRIPMMQRANQTPALDAVRVKVEGGGQAEEPPAEEPPAQPTQPAEPPADNGGGNNGGGQNGGGDGQNGGGQNGGNNGGGQNGGGDNGGGQNGGGDDNGDGQNGGAAPGATATPRTDSGNTPPKTGTVTIPPNKPAGAKPVKTTKPAQAAEPADTDSDSDTDSGSNTGSGSGDDQDSDSAGTDADDPARDDTAAEPATTRKATQKPAAQVVTNDDTGDDGAPDLQAEPNVQIKDDSKLALTGANSMTIIIGGALLVLVGFVILGATRRRRAAADRG